MKIKSVPEDFVVEEILDLKLEESGPYSYFILKKANYNTVDALREVAKVLGIPVTAFNYSGLKDKIALTKQFCSVKNVSRKRLESIELDDVMVEFVGFGSKPIHIGQHEKNFFRIVVRDVQEMPSISPRFVNLFGEQRFGRQNAEIGRAIVKKEFSTACELLNIEGECVNSLRAKLSLVRLCVNAFQSLIWNKAALVWASRTEGDMMLSLPGFGVEIDDVTADILKEEGVTARDFIVREIPELSCEGIERALYVVAENLKVEKENNSVILEFVLPKGSYATEFVRQNFE